jgi:hypothetical protein
MYDYMLYEMADAVARKCNTRIDDAMNALIGYWQDKIAHVWQVEDMLEAARRAGKPILRADAVELLKVIFDNHDSDLGIAWKTLDKVLEDYRLDFGSLPAEKYEQVHGVFMVWRGNHPYAHTFGILPKNVDGNLPNALEFAKTLAQDNRDIDVFVGCKPNLEDKPQPWLTIIQHEYVPEPIISSKE